MKTSAPLTKIPDLNECSKVAFSPGVDNAVTAESKVEAVWALLGSPKASLRVPAARDMVKPTRGQVGGYLDLTLHQSEPDAARYKYLVLDGPAFRELDRQGSFAPMHEITEDLNLGWSERDEDFLDYAMVCTPTGWDALSRHRMTLTTQEEIGDYVGRSRDAVRPVLKFVYDKQPSELMTHPGCPRLWRKSDSEKSHLKVEADHSDAFVEWYRLAERMHGLAG